jgi:hypothetical protein
MENVTRIAALWLVIAAGAICAQEPKTASKPDAKADTAILAAAYKADMGDVAADYEKWVAALKNWYLAGLEKLQGERTKAGDLDGALAFKGEHERIAGDAETTQDQMQAMPPPLGKLRAAYEQALKKINEEVARRKEVARSKHLANLEALQKRLTIRGELDEALIVMKEKDRFAAEMADAAAVGLVKPLEAPGSPATTPSTKPPDQDASTSAAPPATLLASGLGVEQISDLVNQPGGFPIALKGRDKITTKAHFAPPVEITIVAKTDSTNLRIGYAADQVIFNWEVNLQQLRVDGGPAGGKHKSGVGMIPTKKYVTIRWVVIPTKQSIYVDDELRYEHEGNYARIDKPVSVFCHDSKVSVQSIKVRQLPPGASPKGCNWIRRGGIQYDGIEETSADWLPSLRDEGRSVR